MSQIHPPADREAGTVLLLEDGHELIADLIAAARALISAERAGGLIARSLAMILSKCVAPAEATLRRMILLIAATLAPPKAAAQHRKSAGRAGQAPPPAASDTPPRRPVFRLTEPLPRQKTDYIPEHLRPRIRLLDDAVLAAPPPAPVPVPAPRRRASPEKLLARIEHRLAALEAAFADPAREARRWLRRQSRQQADKTPRKPPLAFRRIPGDGPHLNPVARGLLHDLNAAAFNSLAAPAADTS